MLTSFIALLFYVNDFFLLRKFKVFHAIWSLPVDVWDGREEPEIFHGFAGRALTSRLRFSDVIDVIHDYAFVASE